MKVYRDAEGRMYKMLFGIQKVYLTEEEVAWQKKLEETDKATKTKKRILDPFAGYIAVGA